MQPPMEQPQKRARSPWVQGLRLRVYGYNLRVERSGFGVSGLGLRCEIRPLVSRESRVGPYSLSVGFAVQ